MAAKKPIIASNLEGISEIIKDGYNGILYNADDSDDLAKKLQYLLKNKTISENIAEQAWIELTPGTTLICSLLNKPLS